MKNNTIMTTRELADYIKLNEKTILKMAQTGKLPGIKIANQWRFYLSAVDTHLQKSTIKSSSDNLNILIKTIEEDIIPLSRLMKISSINLDLKSRKRDDVLYELAQIANKAGLTLYTKELFHQLRERENMLSTAVGDGIAIPHPRNPTANLFKKPNIIMARSKKGADFFAPDNKKVHLFFMPCATNTITHLRLLRKISKLSHTTNVVQKFMRAGDESEVIKILLEFEKINICPTEET
ncbi:PTS sugar transporter subunit IIA [bacterium]|nr:PTS sugar transporter subunit IIA [bacterium]